MKQSEWRKSLLATAEGGGEEETWRKEKRTEEAGDWRRNDGRKDGESGGKALICAPLTGHFPNLLLTGECIGLLFPFLKK